MLSYVGVVLLMASPVGDRIRQLRVSAGLNQTALGARVGVSRQTISSWENGETSPSVDDLAALATVFGVRQTDLLADAAGSNAGSAGASGRNEAYRGSQRDEFFNVVGRIDERTEAKRLPVYRWGSLGDPRDEMNAPNPDREEYPPAGKESLIGPRGFGVEVRGTSMEGKGIHDGDVVWVNPDKPYRMGNVVLASVSDGNGDSGMVVKMYGETGFGEGLISEYRDERRPVVCREYRIIGPIVWIQRGFPPP